MENATVHYAGHFFTAKFSDTPGIGTRVVMPSGLMLIVIGIVSDFPSHDGEDVYDTEVFSQLKYDIIHGAAKN